MALLIFPFYFPETNSQAKHFKNAVNNIFLIVSAGSKSGFLRYKLFQIKKAFAIFAKAFTESTDSYFFRLSGNDYTIETGELEAQLDAKLLRKTTWFSSHLQFKSFRGKQLTLINSFQDQRYKTFPGFSGKIKAGLSYFTPY